jgi:biotin carboxyl carrier protein
MTHKMSTVAIAEGFSSLDVNDKDEAIFSVLSHVGDDLIVLYGGKKYKAVIKMFDSQTKKAVINVSGFDFKITIKEPIDHLIDQLGFLQAGSKVIKNIKSPMPGLIGTLYVSVGQQVSVDDKLFSLEAMKMENIIKSTGEGIVKKIHVVSGQTVEKNAVIIEFE